jgi:hypothetical protein
MGRDVCGICWCPYDEEGKCGCENVKVINPAADDALQLANELEKYATSGIEKEVAHAVRDLIMENHKLKQDLHHYMLAANAEAQLVDELAKKNEALHKSLKTEELISFCASKGYAVQVEADEALLKQALYVIEAWERGCDKESYERDIDEAIDAIKERLNG